MDINGSEHKSIPELMRETRRLMRRYHAMKRMEAAEVLDSHGGRGRVILLLQKAGEMSQAELADILGVRKQSLGEVLQKLEEEGLITREPAELDKRRLIVKLTDAGLKAQVQTRNMEEVFSCLTEPEQEMLAVYLGKVCDRLTELTAGKDIPEGPPHSHRGPGGPGCGHGWPPFPPFPPMPPERRRHGRFCGRSPW